MPTYGFDETVTEGEWSKALAPATQRGVVYTSSAWEVSHVPGLTRVKIAKGTGSAAGIVHETTVDVLLDLPKPATGGRWFLICATYDFTSKRVDFRHIAHNTTGDTSGDLAPQFMPTAIRTEPGVVWDQPLAFVWVFSGAKSIECINLRIDREGKPAGQSVRAEQRRTGNNFDRLAPGFNTQTSSIIALKTGFPRGDIRYYVSATLRSKAAGNLGAMGNVRVLVNGNARNDDAPYVFKNDWDQWFYTGTYLHPGGVLDIRALSSVDSGEVWYGGTSIQVDWSPSGGITD